jgi:hypothetical protein
MEPLSSGSVAVVALVFAVVALGGVVTGVNGFGFAVVGTSLLAAVLEPRTAVTLMILPILGANVSLVRELSGAGLRRCVRRFWPFVTATAVGTVAGMLLLSTVPARPLVAALGVLVLGYVLVAAELVRTPPGVDPGRLLAVGGAREAFGLASGVVFGLSNVGVQVTAYLDSLELDRETFVGVVAMVFLGVSSVRVAAAVALGLFGGSAPLGLSLAAVLPGLAGVAVGRRIRRRVPERTQRLATFALLAAIGARLVARGLGA